MKVVFYPITDTTAKTEYTALKDLKFSPEADIISNRVSIDQFECKIITDNDIDMGLCAELRDNTDLWFCGRVTYAEREDEMAVHVIVTSELTFLTRHMMPPKMYAGMTAKAAIQEVFSGTGATVLFDETAVAGKSVTGFCNEQSCRNRLQHILFACGLYVKSSFVTHPTITTMDAQTFTVIPLDKTYWKPTPKYSEYVTRVNVFQYSFSSATPQDGDETVTDGTNTWVVTHTNVSLANPNVPAIAETNEVHVEDVMLVNENNVSDILSSLALYYFKRLKVELDVINNGDYNVGDKYSISMSSDDTAQGYCEELDFSFGNQVKSKMVLGACDVVSSSALQINYVSIGDPKITISKRRYSFPQGYQYSVSTEYITMSYGGYEYVFRPLVDAVTGTASSSRQVVTVNCRIALKMNLRTRELEIISVDSVERVAQEEGGTTIYVAEIE